MRYLISELQTLEKELLSFPPLKQKQKMNSRFLAQHFTVNISKFQLPRKGVKSKLSRSSCMYMVLKRPTESCADSEEPLEQIKPQRKECTLLMLPLYLLNVSTHGIVLVQQAWSIFQKFHSNHWYLISNIIFL